jgi:hypothetical protein
MRREPQENRVKRFAIAITTRSLAAFLALSFLATLLPTGAVVAQSIMACCRGKAASHCHVGLKPKKTTSVSSQCKSDCCTCCAPAQQTRNQRSSAQTVVQLTAPVVAVSSFVNITPLVFSREKWAPISPRGPPAFIV